MDMSSMSSSNSSCQLSMLWNWNTVDACFISESWHIQSNGMFAATCIGTLLLVVLLELARRFGREYDAYLVRQFQAHVNASRAAAAVAQSKQGYQGTIGDTIGMSDILGPQFVTFRASPLQQLVRASIYAVIVGLAYFVMLLVMYFNGYIFVMVVLGAGTGKFLCDWLVFRVPLGGAQPATGAKGIEVKAACCG